MSSVEKVPASAGSEPLRITAAQVAAEHIGWQIDVSGRTFTLAGVRSWKRGNKTVVELTDGGDTRGGLYAGTARTYPPDTPCELTRKTGRSRRRTP